MITCRDYASHYISRYPKTEHELTTQLRKKWYPDEEILPTLQRLVSKGYLGDAMYTELYLSSEVVRKGKPLLLIKSKLLMKGVEKSIIQEVSERLESDLMGGTHEKITKEIEKMKMKWIDGMLIIQKLMAKGYTLRDIKAVIKKSSTES